jgi:hypothetical protein
MKKSTMQKHEGKKGKCLLAKGKVIGNLRNEVPGGNQAIIVDKTIKIRALQYLDQKDDHIDTDNRMIDNGIIFRRNIVSNGNHENGLYKATQRIRDGMWT